MSYTNMKKMTALVSLSVISVLGMFGLQERNTRTNHQVIGADIPTLYDRKTVEIVRSDFNFSDTGENAFDIQKGNGNELFQYTGRANAKNATLSDPWIQLENTLDSAEFGNERFKQEIPAGSLVNKWHLTSFSLTYAKRTGTVGQTNFIKINDIDVFDYVSTTKSTSSSILESNSETSTRKFDYNQNITTFEISSTYKFYISKIVLVYTIDYTNC